MLYQGNCACHLVLLTWRWNHSLGLGSLALLLWAFSLADQNDFFCSTMRV